MNTKTSKIILTINIIILLLAVPGFIILDNILNAQIPIRTISLRHLLRMWLPIPVKLPYGRYRKSGKHWHQKLDSNNSWWNRYCKECLPESHNFKWDVIKDGKKLDTYSRDNTVVFKPADKYNEIDGVTTFRGNNYRNSASFGSANVRKKNSRKFGVSK